MGRPKKPITKKRTFEECFDEINKVIESRRHRWMLTAITYMNWEDVAQHLRLHIWKKFHLYNQSRPLHSWLSAVINNQMINLIRNNYGNFKRPCIECPFYQGENLCEKFGEVSAKCPEYKTWTFGKKQKHDINLPVPIENHQNEVFDIKHHEIDIDKIGVQIHDKMRKILKPLHWFVYNNLFILHKSEEDVGKLLNFKSKEKDRAPGYKQVSNLKRDIIIKVKELIKNGEIEI